MRKAVCIALLNIIIISFAFGQIVQKNKFEVLEDKISKDSSFEEIKENVSVAQKVFQKKVRNVDNKQLEYDALLQQANVKKKAFAVLRSKIYSTEQIPAKERLKMLDYHFKNGDNLLEMLEDAVSLYDNSGAETLQKAQACFDFGWLNDDYSPPETLSDKSDKIKKTQNMYAKAYDLRKKLLGNSDEATLVTMNFLADSYLKGGNFEQALPLYEKFISLTEKKYGRTFEPLLPALHKYRSILWLLGDYEEIVAIEKQIFEIADEKKDLPINLSDLSLRAKNLNYKGLRENENNISLKTNSPIWRDNTGKNIILDGNITQLNPPPEFRIIIPSDSYSEVSITKARLVSITVDENGKVIEAKAEKTDEETATKIEEIVMKWEFVPFNYEGARKKKNGFVYYKEEKSSGF